MTYWDFQISAVFAGAGVGGVMVKSIDTENWSFGYRTKLWGGSILLLTYDYSIISGLKNRHNLGLMGIIPGFLG